MGKFQMKQFCHFYLYYLSQCSTLTEVQTFKSGPKFGMLLFIQESKFPPSVNKLEKYGGLLVFYLNKR